jgi:hypothetical protein
MSKGDVSRYTALVVAVQNVHRRTVGKYGDEVIPNFKKDINRFNTVLYSFETEHPNVILFQNQIKCVSFLSF